MSLRSPLLVCVPALLVACAGAPEAPSSDLDDPASSPVAVTQLDDALDDKAPRLRTLALQVDDRKLTMDLRRADELFSEHYVERWIGPDGEPVPRPRATWANAVPCYYRGPVRDERGDTVGHAALRTCDAREGLHARGLVALDDALHALEPTLDGHLLRRAAALDQHDPLHGVLEARGTLDALGLSTTDTAPGVRSDDLPAPPPLSTTLGIELSVGQDAARHALYGDDTAYEGALTLNAVAALYEIGVDSGGFNPSVGVAMVEQVVFEGTDPWSLGSPLSSVNAENLLTAWGAYGDGNLIGDNYMLMSGREFNGSTLGLAWVGGMCASTFDVDNERSSNVSQATWDIAANAGILAHELGHNLYMIHDGERDVGLGLDARSCPAGQNIMSAYAGLFRPETTFSNCSFTAYQTRYAQGGFSCLTDPAVEPQPVCGNGEIEMGEECDCGAADCSAIDPCCDGASCKGTTGATCTDVHGYGGRCFVGQCVTYADQCDDAESLLAAIGYTVGPNESCYAGSSSSTRCTQLRCDVSAGGGTFCADVAGSASLTIRDGTPCATDKQCLDGACTAVDQLPGADLCPGDPAKTAPGACGCGTPDLDGDSDGTPDCQDDCPADPLKTEPGDCGCGEVERDPDFDGVPTCIDACPGDPGKIEPGDCGCGTADVDADADGTADCIDGCPNDDRKVSPGVCGCGTPDYDPDFDGVPTCNDGCPGDPGKIEPGVCGCGTADADADSDGTPNCVDGCPADPDKTEPGVCGCGTADVDADSDGTPDCNDACPSDAAKVVPGTCGCGTSDVDADSDGTPDCNDACPNDAAKVVPGTCGCGTADVDADSDGTPDCNDACPADPDKTEPGDCGCGVADLDADSDSIPDCDDGCPADPDKTEPGDCGCGVADLDADSDSTPDCDDGCPTDPDKTDPGDCGCGVADLDADSDSTPDCNDACPNDSAKVVPGTCGCGVADLDADSDSTPDCLQIADTGVDTDDTGVDTDDTGVDTDDSALPDTDPDGPTPDDTQDPGDDDALSSACEGCRQGGRSLPLIVGLWLPVLVLRRRATARR